MLDHAKVMRHEQHRQPKLLLQVLNEVDHLRLHRHIKRRDRLVGDDEVGADGEGAGDADALALAAGELVRIAPCGVGGQADLAQQACHPGRALAAGA